MLLLFTSNTDKAVPNRRNAVLENGVEHLKEEPLFYPPFYHILLKLAWNEQAFVLELGPYLQCCSFLRDLSH